MKIKNRFLRQLRDYLYLYLVDITDTLPWTPRDFIWKVRWRMRHDRNPLFIKLAGKYKVKAYAESLGVKTAKLYYVTDNPETIPFDTLPETYFIKANHGCLWNILCKGGEFYLFENGEHFTDRNDISKYKLSREECIQKCKLWLNSVYSKREWVYTQITPKIMLEEALAQRGGGEFKDYKFHVFHGEVKAVLFLCPTNRTKYIYIYFDRDWQVLKIYSPDGNTLDAIPEKPEKYSKMVKIAEKLADGLDFVRVDLYDTTRGIVLGEMTFYPHGGWPVYPTSDPSFNQWFGGHWNLPMLQTGRVNPLPTAFNQWLGDQEE
jgi:hypothetical protein